MDKIFKRRMRSWLWAWMMLTLASSGCRHVSAPIHVWSPPRLQSAVGHKIAIAPIAGDAKIAGPLHTAMIAMAPRDQGRALYAIDARALPSLHSPHENRQSQTIRLVSATEGESSDIAMHSIAKRSDVDFLLTGEVVRRASDERKNRVVVPPDAQPIDAETPAADVGAIDREVAAQDTEDYLTVSWKLVDVRGQQPSAGMPIVTRHNAKLTAREIADAAATDAWKLITPHVQTASVKLASSRLSFGSERVRKGNLAAIEGDWLQAEQRWNQVLTRYPSQHAAMHNLAIAAVARQDYEAAQRLIGQALQRRNLPLYRETAVWIEASRRDYHEAFGLPDPVGGWSATRR